MTKPTLTLLLATLAIGMSQAAFAQDTPPIKPGNPAGWQTWTWNETCYAFLTPKSETEAAVDAEGAYIAIKHMPIEETFDSVAIVSGQGETSGHVGRIDIDGQIFNLLPYQGAGFVSTGEREEKLLNALVGGTEARVTWTSDDGMIVQNYELAGLMKAKKVIDVGCKEPTPGT